MGGLSEDTVWFLISLAVLAFLGWRWFRGRQLRSSARNWPTAIGKIQATDMRIESRGNGQSMHVAEVLYAFEALGAQHQGRWKRESILYGKLKKWVDGNIVGNDLWVRYNPQDANVSVILEQDQGLVK